MEAPYCDEEAKQAKVPVHKDSKLADTLSKLEIGDMIPPELYEVVAEILVFVDQMDKMSFSRFIFPENEDEVLDELKHKFNND